MQASCHSVLNIYLWSCRVFGRLYASQRPQSFKHLFSSEFSWVQWSGRFRKETILWRSKMNSSILSQFRRPTERKRMHTLEFPNVPPVVVNPGLKGKDKTETHVSFPWTYLQIYEDKGNLHLQNWLFFQLCLVFCYSRWPHQRSLIFNFYTAVIKK